MKVGYDDNINDGGDNFHNNNNINCRQEGPIAIRKDQYTNDRKGGSGKFLLATGTRDNQNCEATLIG